MAKYRESKGGLGDEHVAWLWDEAGAGRVSCTLVVAAHHDAAASILHHHLCAAQHVPGGLEPDTHIIDANGLAPSERLLRLPCPLPEPFPHQRQGLGAGQHRTMARAGMVGVGMGNYRTVDRARRIDEEAGGLAEQSLWQHAEPTGGRLHMDGSR
jgi:hypothetical protein